MIFSVDYFMFILKIITLPITNYSLLITHYSLLL